MNAASPRTGRGLTGRAIVLMVIGLVVPALLLGYSGARTLREY